MSVLARKIARAKWETKPDLGSGEIAADAVTADLRTTSNRLSFWRCESADGKHLESAVLALAAGAERADRLDVVYLDENAVFTSGLATVASPGDTPIPSLRDRHVDIEKLDLDRLGRVAQMIAAAHRLNASHSMTKKGVVELVAQAVKGGLLSVSELKDKMRDQVEAKLRESQ